MFAGRVLRTNDGRDVDAGFVCVIIRFQNVRDVMRKTLRSGIIITVVRAKAQTEAPSCGQKAYWASEPSGGPTLPTSIDGILDADDAAYLLTTAASGGDGELDGLLVRAPACSLVRFERYRHLLAPSASTLTTSHPSSTGAIVLRTLPAATPASGAPRAGLCVGTPARHARAVPAIAVPPI